MDLSTYWAIFRRYKSSTGYFLLLLLFFVGGWQVGKITSPYYAAHPIIFEDTACDRTGGNPEDLSTLEDKGIASRSSAPTPSVSITPTNSVNQPPTAAVAGTQDMTVQKKFVGSVNSNLFHDPSCGSSKRIKPANQIWFASIEEAKQAGYSPSKCTREKLGL